MKYNILIDKNFQKEFINSIKKAKKRIWVQFMTFEGDNAGLELAQELIIKKNKV